MKMKTFVWTFFVICGVLGSEIGVNGQVNEDVYHNAEYLDPDGKFLLEWSVNFSTERIHFKVTAETNGYVGFGLSARGQLDGADIVIGGVTPNGRAYFTDRHGVGNREPRVDESQDYDAHAVWENNTHTFLSFSRAFDTCDKDDYAINEHDVVSLIWAYGVSDDISQFAREKNGRFLAYLLDPDYTPTSIKQSVSPGTPRAHTGLDLSLWTTSSRLRLPAQEAFYHCNFHKAPRLRKKHHGVGYQVRFNTEEGARHTHHLLMYRCVAPPDMDPAELFGPHVNSGGDECYSLSSPLGNLPTQYCTEMLYGWGTGARATFLPEHVGFSMGDSPDEYYLTQIHYDNTELLTNIEYDVIIDVFYTDRLRNYDGGVIAMAHGVPGSPSLIVPPNSTEHHIYGHCSGVCTDAMMPAEGIKVFGVLMHTHRQGKTFRVQHFRGNDEQPWITSDDNYNNGFQHYRMLRNEVNVKPGDQVTIRCGYDNTHANGSLTTGGFSTRQEMCLIYVMHYKRLVGYSFCRSQISSPEYTSHYLGFTNGTWNQTLMEYVATAPGTLAGWPVSRISEVLIDWTKDLRSELQQDHKMLPQVGGCSRLQWTPDGRQVDVSINRNSHPVQYPSGGTVYTPPVKRTCRPKIIEPPRRVVDREEKRFNNNNNYGRQENRGRVPQQGSWSRRAYI